MGVHFTPRQMIEKLGARFRVLFEGLEDQELLSTLSKEYQEKVLQLCLDLMEINPNDPDIPRLLNQLMCVSQELRSIEAYSFARALSSAENGVLQTSARSALRALLDRWDMLPDYLRSEVNSLALQISVFERILEHELDA